MAIIAKFISYDGGIAFSEKVMQIKRSENTPPERILIPDIASLNVRKPQEDADGFIRVSTADGLRYRIFFEDDQYREAIQFKKNFDALVSELSEEEPEEPPRRSVSEAHPDRHPGRGVSFAAPRSGFPMTTWKLVAGILSIILSMFVLFQSCAAGLGNAMAGNNEVGGSAGAIVAVLLLAGGILSIAARKGSRGGNIAIAVLFGLAAVLGFLLAGSYSDLKIWSAWCLINAVLALISLYGGSKAARTGNNGNRKLLLLSVCAAAVIVIIAIVVSIAGGSENNSSPDVAAALQSQGNVQTAPEQAGGAGQIGDYLVEIKDAYQTTDYEGNPSLVVNYAWTNNSVDTTCAEAVFSEKAFQDGVQLDSTLLSDDPEASWAEIRPGTTLDVHAVFVLRSGSAVEFEITDLFGLTDPIKKSFDLSGT